MSKYYAGIGQRDTPKYILTIMFRIACELAEHGFILRSGGAIGADTAFESGTAGKDIFRAEDATANAIKFASGFHPAWNACSKNSRQLLGRNAMIVLGKNLDIPVDFVVCWSENETRGGTAIGIKIANHYGIPVFNLNRICNESNAEIQADRFIRMILEKQDAPH